MAVARVNFHLFDFDDTWFVNGYGIIKGARGQEGVNEEKFIDTIVRLSALVKTAPEIFEMDINPLLGNKKDVVAVDARIRIEK